MSIDNHLQTLASNMIIRDTKKEAINLSFTTLEARLKSFFGSDISKIIKFGSYSRGTILPRNFDEQSDIDIMIVFNNTSGFQPQTFLSKLKKFAQEKYSTSEIYQSSPTIVLELNHIKFELVPAIKPYSWDDDTYQIPKNPTSWMITNPKSFDDELVLANRLNSNKIKPVVRLIKYWNITQNNRNMPSFEIEKNIASKMQYTFYTKSSYSDYVVEALKSIRSYGNGARIDSTVKLINDAKELEAKEFPYSAIAKLEQCFPGKP